MGRKQTPDSVDEFVARWAEESPLIDDETEGITARLRLVLRHLDRETEQRWRALGVDMSDVRVLQALIAAGGTSTPSDLAQSAQVSPSGMTGQLDRLESRTLVKRSIDGQDGRRRQVTLTASGRKLWRSAVAAGVDVQGSFYEVLDTGERKAFNRSLRALLSKAEREQPPQRRAS